AAASGAPQRHRYARRKAARGAWGGGEARLGAEAKPEPFGDVAQADLGSGRLRGGRVAAVVADLDREPAIARAGDHFEMDRRRAAPDAVLDRILDQRLG